MNLRPKCAYCGKGIHKKGQFDADPTINRIVVFCNTDCRDKYYKLLGKRGNDSQVKEKLKNPNKIMTLDFRGKSKVKPVPIPNII